MTPRHIRTLVLLLAILAGSLISVAAQPNLARAAGKTHLPTAEHTYFTCVWHGQTIRLKHIHNNPVERYRDAVLVGRCTKLSTNDRYYSRLVGHSINVFVAWSHYPGLYVVHNALQGSQPLYGDWTFPVTQSAGTLTGKVTDSASAKPISAATVSAKLCTSSPTKHCAIQTAATTNKGAYSINFYVPGTYKVSVQAQGYASSPTTSVSVRSGRSATSNFALVFAPATTSLVLTANPNPATVNAPVSLSATIGAPVSDGTVTFSGTGPSGATFATTTCTPAKGTCAVTWIPTAAGAWSIKASWSGDSRYAAVTNTLAVTVNPLTSTLTLAVSPNPVPVNQTASVSATLAAPVSDGAITISGTGPGGATLAAKTCTPTAGACSVSFAPTVSGTWTISASYSGDATYGPAQATLQVPVSGGSTTLALANSPNPLPVNTSGTLTATLNQPVSDGTVTFSYAGPNNATLPSTTCMPASGVCTTTWRPTAAGSWTVTARWSGDSLYGATSGSLQVSVGGGTSVLTVTANPNPVTLGQATTLTASFNPPVNDGTVTFTGTGPNGATFPSNLTCTPTNGACTQSWTPSTPGSWTVTALWQGDASYAPAAGSVTVTVSGTQGQLSLTESPNPLPSNEQGVLTATLAQAMNGTVTFTGTSSTGAAFTTTTCTLVNGTCSIVWQPAGQGTYTITASYPGVNGTGAATQQITVAVTTPQFLALTEAPNPLAVTQSGTVTATIQVANTGSTVNFTFTSPTGATTTAQCSITSTVCTVPFHPTSAGLWTINGFWSGTQGPQTASATIQAPVTGTTTTLALTANPPTVAINQTATLTATVSPSVSTGTVTFTGTGPSANAFTTQTCTLVNGSCSITYQFTQAGTYTVTASYGGSGAYSGASNTVTVTVAGGTLTVTANPTSVQVSQQDQVLGTLQQALAGQTITFTFTDSDNTTAPSMTCATSAVGSCGVYWYPPRAGTWTVTATWPGNTAYNAESGSTQVLVQAQAFSVSVSPNPVTVNQSATITANFGQGQNGDSVNILLTAPNGGPSRLVACILQAGTCSTIVSFNAGGTWQISATVSDPVLRPPTATTTVNVLL